jgi:two-component system, OmpR family, alkaline phosphatase synthesis response regulator PhoP
MKILLVEDEVNIRKLMKLNLELEGFEVIEAADGKQAYDLIYAQYFDIIILDLMLPHINGLDLCEQIRLKDNQVKIMIVSAKDGVQDRILGLKLGADDYLSKPFALEEFLLRVKNLFKRSAIIEHAADAFTFGTNTIYFNEFRATTSSGDITLTSKEVMLLKMLIDRKNQVVNRNQILQTVWGYDVYPSTRTIDNFILAFRKYFEENAKEPIYFHTIRGVGYKFVG